MQRRKSALLRVSPVLKRTMNISGEGVLSNRGLGGAQQGLSVVSATRWFEVRGSLESTKLQAT